MKGCLCSYHIKIMYSKVPCTESQIPSLRKRKGFCGSGPPAHTCVLSNSWHHEKLTRSKLPFLGTVFCNVSEKCLYSTKPTCPFLCKMVLTPVTLSLHTFHKAPSSDVMHVKGLNIKTTIGPNEIGRQNKVCYVWVRLFVWLAGSA